MSWSTYDILSGLGGLGTRSLAWQKGFWISCSLGGSESMDFPACLEELGLS